MGISNGHFNIGTGYTFCQLFYKLLHLETFLKHFTFIDLFAGVGGFRLGFERVGGTCVFSSEINPFAVTTYEANFPSHKVTGDITKIDAKDIPDHDVLLGGFPCQAFSSAGKQLGFEDTRGTLFFEIARILKEKKPKAFMLENVSNLTRHDKGKTYSVILQTLRDLGYEVHARKMTSSPLVPQDRNRIYIVGFREASSFNLDTLSLGTGTPCLADILHPEDGTEAPSSYTDALGKILPKYTLSDKLWSFLQAHAENHKTKGNGFGYSLVTPSSVARTLTARYGKDGSEILVAQSNANPRKLTPRECARLMGFPDTFKIPVSDTQAYKQFGNSVVVPVIEAIAKHMLPHL